MADATPADPGILSNTWKYTGADFGPVPHAAILTALGGGLGYGAGKAIGWLNGDNDSREGKDRTSRWRNLGLVAGLGLGVPGLYAGWQRAQAATHPDQASVINKFDNYNSLSPAEQHALPAHSPGWTGWPSAGNIAQQMFSAKPGAEPMEKANGALDVFSFGPTEDSTFGSIGHIRVPEVGLADMYSHLPWDAAHSMVAVDPSLSPVQRVKLQQMADLAVRPAGRTMFKQLVDAGVDAGIGYGAAYGIGQVLHAFLGTPAPMRDAMARAGAIGGALRSLSID